MPLRSVNEMVKVCHGPTGRIRPCIRRAISALGLGSKLEQKLDYQYAFVDSTPQMKFGSKSLNCMKAIYL
jgi:hypothetical protein